VRSLNQAEAMKNLIGGLKKCGIMIVALQEIKWRGTMCLIVKITQSVIVRVLEQGTFLVLDSLYIRS
jgi:hypothetical protein